MILFEEIVHELLHNGRNTKYTTEEWVNTAKKIRGEKYDYSKVNYVNSSTKILIGCPIHGYFEVRPVEFLRGQGCPKCSHPSKKSNTKEFIEKAKKIHGNKYDYSKTVYQGKDVPVTITCPVHGDFQQTPHNHLNNHGCYQCGRERTKKAQFLTQEKFIEKAKLVHNNKYDYSKTNYERFNKPVIITCPIHGDFEQLPVNHLQGCGCQKCAYEKNMSEEKLLTVIKENFPKYNIIHQYKPQWLKNGVGFQSIDIFIDGLNIGIEYQGKQHFVPVTHYGGEEHYKVQRERDERKYNLCKKHGITLFYFSYEKRISFENYLDYVFTSEEELINKIKQIASHD